MLAALRVISPARCPSSRPGHRDWLAARIAQRFEVLKMVLTRCWHRNRAFLQQVEIGVLDVDGAAVLSPVIPVYSSTALTPGNQLSSEELPFKGRVSDASAHRPFRDSHRSRELAVARCDSTNLRQDILSIVL